MADKKFNAIVYCEGAFNTPNGKTAHGLVRYTERFNIISIIDSNYAGKNSGMILDGKPNKIEIFPSLDEAFYDASNRGIIIYNFIIGLAPDGGKMPEHGITAVTLALKARLNIYSGLHDFLSENEYLLSLANRFNCTIKDIRKPPSRQELHFFSGKIEKVKCPKIAILGTDSAIGKRTTAWHLVKAFEQNNKKTILIGTGQTAWMQGAKYSIILDSLVNDFVSGEIEHAVYKAYTNENPDILILEGQGSLLNPAYPGGFEIIAAGRPDYIILQHAPRRKEYDGFPGYALHSIHRQISAIEIISGIKVVAITINHEGMLKDEIMSECQKIHKETGLPTFDTLEYGATELMNLLESKIKKWNK